MRTTISFTGFVLVAVMGLSAAGQAQESGRLLATSGVTRPEGAGDSAPWALITGHGTRDADMRDASASLPSFNHHGRSMAAPHAGLDLGHAKLDAVAENLRTTMERAGVPYWTRNRLMALPAPMRRDVVIQ